MDFISVPNEIILNVAANLSTRDRCGLAYTSKHMHALINPLIWSHIEFHSQGYHLSEQELEVPSPYISPWKHDALTMCIGWKLFHVLRPGANGSDSRSKELMAHVRSLCGVVGAEHSIRFWRLLPSFVNLTALEIDCTYWRTSDKERFAPEITQPPIPHLRYAKLFGYVPRSVARWVIFKCGATLERLELGMLDRPLSQRYFQPLPEDILGELNSHRQDLPLGIESEDWHIPRPLGGFLPAESDGEEELALPKLRHLYLCRPTIRLGRYVEYAWSAHAEQASLADWSKILQSCSKTLRTLVLEDRPGAVSMERNTWDSPRFMQADKEGLGGKSVVEMVEGALLEQDAFPELKHAYLYGFPIGPSLDKPDELVPGGRLMERFKESGIECEARLGCWCYFDWNTGRTDWERWASDVEYSDEDEESASGDEDEYFSWDSVLGSTREEGL